MNIREELIDLDAVVNQVSGGIKRGCRHVQGAGPGG